MSLSSSGAIEPVSTPACCQSFIRINAVSSGSPNAISAVLRTLPATTILPIIFIISVISTEVIKGLLERALASRIPLIPLKP